MSPHHVPASIVDKQRTSPLYNRTTFQTRLTPCLPFRRRFAEICPYSGWHLYVSLDIYLRACGPSPLVEDGSTFRRSGSSGVSSRGSGGIVGQYG